MLRNVAKVFLWIIAGVLSLLILGLVVSLVVYPPQYVFRLLSWGETDVDDYRNNFPARTMEAADDPFYFDRSLDEEKVRSLFEEQLDVPDFDAFLAEAGTQAFIVIKGDDILYENYFNNSSRETIVTSFSVAKSFVTALAGMAVADGSINSIQDPITDYLPELAERDPRFGAVTIRHLMMMAGGVGYEEMKPALFSGDDPLTSYYPDQRKAALEFAEIVDPPGEYFLYNKYYPQL